MAQWKSVSEPYIKVQERIMSETTVPTSGEDLIIGTALITDAGPATPTLIQSQTEFLNTYASQSLTEDYLNSLDKLNDGSYSVKNMWLNAYRLAGSGNLLVVRATKGDDMHFAKSINASADSGTYILKNGNLLKKVNTFKLVIDSVANDAASPQKSNGWAISVSGVGVIGNLTTDEGPQYDYFANTLPELVDYLNDSDIFFAPKVKYYKDSNEISRTQAEVEDAANRVVFEEVYLGKNFLDRTDTRVVTDKNDGAVDTNLSGEDKTKAEKVEKSLSGLAYLLPCTKDWASSTDTSMIIDLNSTDYSGYTATANYYATNVYNSHSDLKVRIRRFNHDAVVDKSIDTPDANKDGVSPYQVLGNVLVLYKKDLSGSTTSAETKDTILGKDFYEFAVLDPSVSGEVLYYNVGNIPGRGDLTVKELNNSLQMINFHLPDNLGDLGLDYYNPADTTKSEIVLNLDVDPDKTDLLSVDINDLKKAIDKLELDDTYITEGLTDLGYTDPSYQNYLANLAANGNYFYPISTVNSSNYLAIANSINRVSGGSKARYKLYASAPWDEDSGTVGFQYYASPSVIYWEAVNRNRALGKEFAAVFGQNNGFVAYQSPVTQFNKKTRELLLGKKINTVKWNQSASQWEMNDSFTLDNTQDNTIMQDDGNSRLAIRIAKNVGECVKQYIGEKIGSSMFTDVEETIKAWMNINILPLKYGIDDFNVTVNDDTINPVSLQRQNKMRILLEVRFERTLKYITIIDQIYDVGQDFTGTIAS